MAPITAKQETRHCISDSHASIITRNQFCILCYVAGGMGAYRRGDSFCNPREFVLNLMCTRDRDLWHMRCPLICNWAVELHLPHRVYHQFGLFQPHPPEWEDTDKMLHA